MIGRKSVNLIVGWCGRFLFFVVPREFSQDIASQVKVAGNKNEGKVDGC